MKKHVPRVAFAVCALAIAGSVDAQSRPAEPYLVEGGCPFECCVYGEWMARSSFPAYTAERDTASVAFSLVPGESFVAVTGNVHITELGVVEVVRRLHQNGLDSGGMAFEAGDTLFVLDYLGEGFFNVWYQGDVIQATDYWWSESELEGADPERVRALQHREPESEWWVRIRKGDGSSGWLRMDQVRVSGADGCAT